MDRVAIYDALYAKLVGCYPWASTFPHRVDWDQATKPALCMEQGYQKPVYQDPLALPPIWKLEAVVLVYWSKVPMDDEPFQGSIQEAVQAIEGSLAFNAAFDSQFPGAANSYGTTLGGLCQGCRIEGEVAIEHGETADLTVAIMQIVITAPSPLG